MKRIFWSLLVCALALPPAAQAGGGAGAPASAKAALVALKAATATVKVLGDSTVHKWEFTAMSLTLSAEIKNGKGLLAGAKAGALKKLDLVLAVAELKSDESGMDKNMRKAMQSDQFPEISFSLKGYSLEGATVTAQGALSIHGTTKDVELTGFLEEKDGALSVKGSYDLLMSDYGVKPPVMMMGTIRVKDAVTITYDYELSKP